MITTALTMGTIIGTNTVLTNTVAGNSINPTEIIKSLWSIAPLSLGLPLPATLGLMAANKTVMDATSGQVSNLGDILQNSATLSALGFTNSILGRAFTSAAVGNAFSIMHGNVPDITSLGRDVLLRSVWGSYHGTPMTFLPNKFDFQNIISESSINNPLERVSQDVLKTQNENLTAQLPPVQPPSITSTDIKQWEDAQGLHIKATIPLTVDITNHQAQNIIAKFTPQSITEQFKENDGMIITNSVLNNIEQIPYSHQATGKRYIIHQEGYDADILTANHWNTLMERFSRGEYISWDHVVLALLSALKSITPEIFKSIVEQWTLNSSAKISRIITVDVFATEYIHVDTVKENITSHDKLTIERTGKDIELNTAFIQNKEESIGSKTVVYTANITKMAVDLPHAQIVEEVLHHSVAEQEVEQTLYQGLQQKIDATLEGNIKKTAESPIKHAQETYTQWTSFSSDMDLTKLAEAGHILPNQVQENPQIQLISYNEDPASIQEWQEPISETVTQQGNSLQKLLFATNDDKDMFFSHVDTIIKEMDDNTELTKPDSMHTRHSDISSKNNTEEVIKEYTEKGNIIDDKIVTKKLSTHSTYTETVLQGLQCTREQFVAYKGPEGERELARPPLERYGFITEQITVTDNLHQQDSTTTASKILPSVLGKSIEMGPTTHTKEGYKTQTMYFVKDVDITPFLAEGRLSDPQKNLLNATKIHSEHMDIAKHSEVDESTASRTFEEGWIAFAPLGSIAGAAMKSSYGYELTGSDYFWSAADLGLTFIGAGATIKAIKGSIAAKKHALRKKKISKFMWTVGAVAAVGGGVALAGGPVAVSVMLKSGGKVALKAAPVIAKKVAVSVAKQQSAKLATTLGRRLGRKLGGERGERIGNSLAGFTVTVLAQSPHNAAAFLEASGNIVKTETGRYLGSKIGGYAGSKIGYKLGNEAGEHFGKNIGIKAGGELGSIASTSIKFSPKIVRLSKNNDIKTIFKPVQTTKNISKTTIPITGDPLTSFPKNVSNYISLQGKELYCKYGSLVNISVNDKLWKKNMINNISKTYKTNGAIYSTDNHGRSNGVSIKKLTMRTGGSRDNITQNIIGKLGTKSDEGGHLLGHRFGGIGTAANLVPQNANLNRGAWKRMENTWAKSLQSGKDVTNVNIRPVYYANSARPYKFEAKYTLGGQDFTNTFYNKFGEVYDKTN